MHNSFSFLCLSFFFMSSSSIASVFFGFWHKTKRLIEIELKQKQKEKRIVVWFLNFKPNQNKRFFKCKKLMNE